MRAVPHGARCGSKKSEGIKKGASAPKRNNQYPDSGRFADNLLNLPDTGLFYASFHSRESAFHITFRRTDEREGAVPVELRVM